MTDWSAPLKLDQSERESSTTLDSHNRWTRNGGQVIGAQPAEVVIEPEVLDIELSEFMRAEELSRVGEEAAISQLANIQQLLARLDVELFS